MDWHYIYQESLYQCALLSKDETLIKKSLSIRKETWKENFGSPSVEFLLEYAEEIEKLKNTILSNQKFEKKFEKIQEPPQNDGFILTLNSMGFMRTEINDLYSKEFLNFSKNKKVLEIGAAYGVLSLECLRNGSTVYANDLDSKHLQILKEKWGKDENFKPDALKLVSGSFPNEFDFPDDTFDGISIIRVLHFFHPTEIQTSLKKLFKWLKPGGKLFISNETPFLKNVQKFIPVYEERLKSNQHDWPSFLEDVSKYVDVYSYNLPKFLTLFTSDILSRELKKSNFEIEKVSFVDQQEFPKNMRLDGRESCGGIAVKPIFKSSLPSPLRGMDSKFNEFTHHSIVERVPSL
jgi:SAM-dependent methyltransferase